MHNIIRPHNDNTISYGVLVQLIDGSPQKNGRGESKQIMYEEYYGMVDTRKGIVVARLSS